MIEAAVAEKTVESSIGNSAEINNSNFENKSPFSDSSRPNEVYRNIPELKNVNSGIDKKMYNDSERPKDNGRIEQPLLYSAETKENNVKDSSDDINNQDAKDKRIPCRNEELAGKEHPITGVTFEKKTVMVEGQEKEVVVPVFDSVFDAQLPDDKLKSSDSVQFKECNSQLKEAVNANHSLRINFTDEQIEQIENSDTPDGYTWHHDAETGKMQLVDTEKHQQTGHTGGRNIWGGGSDNR